MKLTPIIAALALSATPLAPGPVHAEWGHQYHDGIYIAANTLGDGFLFAISFVPKLQNCTAPVLTFRVVNHDTDDFQTDPGSATRPADVTLWVDDTAVQHWDEMFYIAGPVQNNSQAITVNAILTANALYKLSTGDTAAYQHGAADPLEFTLKGSYEHITAAARDCVASLPTTTPQVAPQVRF